MIMVEYIINGEREEPVIGTPVKYYELYKECWQDYPDQRPDCLIASKKLELIDMEDVISKWNLHKGLRVPGNTFVYGKEILTEDGTITPNKARQPVQIYTNKSSNPFEILKNESISAQKLDEIDICLHVLLLNIKYENFKIADGFNKLTRH
ncbi:kinase-like protein [Gigaspora margarita]|uniref:Kinase-like protein n=1 Tax=Gigaspora margarita TaxID=4874 RepID=A0A8H4ATW7_GIGMA|nr:kinase-like protein [Gigaspora margarita]